MLPEKPRLENHPCRDLQRVALIRPLEWGSAERGCAPLRGCDPWPIHPRRVVTYVLPMAAFELGDPLALVILVVSRDSSVHERILVA
jgi:hypothetical protein